MLIECDRCEMRDIACPDCVVTHLLADGEPVADLDAAERRGAPGARGRAAGIAAAAASLGQGVLTGTRRPGRGRPCSRDTPAFCARHAGIQAGVRPGLAGAGPTARLTRTPFLEAICGNRNAWPWSSRSPEFAKRLNSPCELH